MGVEDIAVRETWSTCSRSSARSEQGPVYEIGSRQGGTRLRAANSVYPTMRSDSDTTAGEVVYLLAELRCEGKGSVLEIGSRARVLESDGDRVTLAVAHGGGEDIVTCSRALVARRERSLTSRRTLRPSSRPAF